LESKELIKGVWFPPPWGKTTKKRGDRVERSEKIKTECGHRGSVRLGEIGTGKGGSTQSVQFKGG